MKILVDSLEPPQIAASIAAHPLLCQPEVRRLEAGDVWIDNLIIERKEPADLLASIADARLFNQVAAMRSLSEWVYVVITGQLTPGYISGTNWTLRSIQGALLKAQELGAHIVTANGEADFAPTLAWLYKRDRSKIVILDPRKYGIPMTQAQEIMASLPGIGPERAGDMLQELDTVARCLEWLTGNDPVTIPGIGPKTREGCKKALGLKSDESLRRVKNER